MTPIVKKKLRLVKVTDAEVERARFFPAFYLLGSPEIGWAEGVSVL